MTQRRAARPFFALAVAALAAFTASGGRAEVVDVAENGFTIRNTVVVSADPAEP